jgi:hypothetical protein
MKTPMQRLIEHVRQQVPDLEMSESLIYNFTMLEKLEQQMAYNAGFSKAKEIYETNEYNTKE